MPRMRIKSASTALGVPVPTLRRWTQEFASGLSPEARASEGRPREFTPRDMRVLRRAKEVLDGEDVTYERARRMLAGEGLLSYQPEPDSDGGVGSARDESADREAAERFVRDVVGREVGPLRDVVSALAARIGELERELRQLREAQRTHAPPAREDSERRPWFR